MNKLIRLQLRNIFHSKLFYVCLILTLILGPILEFVVSVVVKAPEVEAPMVFPGITKFLSSEVSLISKIFIVLFCCFDFTEGTTKNIIARGYTRRQLLFSKYIVSFFSLFIMYAVASLLYFVFFSSIGMGYDSNTILLLVNNIIAIFAYVIFFATISFILEKNSSAIIVCLMIPTIISLALTLIDSKLKLDIGKYWLDNISNEFLKKPDLSNLGLSSLMYLIYILIFIFSGITLLKNKEIK